MSHVKTPDGIPPGWELNFDHDTIILKKISPKPHWTTKLAPWPKYRPGSVVLSVSFQDRIVFVDGYRGKLVGIPFSHIEDVYDEICRVRP